MSDAKSPREILRDSIADAIEGALIVVDDATYCGDCLTGARECADCKAFARRAAGEVLRVVEASR